MADKVIGVYVIEHLATGRRYVGKTTNLRRRLRNHFSGANTKCRFLHAAIRKYGRSAFATSSVACETEAQATDVEVLLIAHMNTMAPHGFNLTAGGEGVRGLIPSAATREKMSVAHVGHTRTEESKRRQSDTVRAFWATDDGREVVRLQALKRTGGKRTPETRARMSAAQLGTKRTPEALASIRALRRARMGAVNG